MKYLIRCLVLIILNAIFSHAYSQTTDSSKRWNLQQCFQYATDHNIQVNTLRLNKQTAEQDLYAAKGVKIPSLSGAVANTFNNANNNPKGNGTLVNQLTSTGSYSVNSSIVLWNDNFINNTIRQNDLLVQSAGLSVQESLNNITLSITQAYLNILLSKENKKYVMDLVSTTDSSVRQGQLLYDAGSIAKVSLLQLQAQLASDKYLLVQTQNSIRQNLLSLKQLLQLPTDTLFDIAIPVSVEVGGVMPLLTDVEQTALRDFPEIKIGKLGVDIASLDVFKAKAAFKPVLSANGALGSGYYDVFTNNVLPKTQYLTQTGNNFYQNLGVTLSVPIFSQRINKTNLEKANIAFKVADLNYQNNQLILSQAVEQAYLNALNAKQSYDAANIQLLAVSESYRIANDQFKLGAITTYDLLVQQNQYVQAVQAYTQAKYTAVLQQKIYEFYIGKPVTL